ncbi:hypothetical protein A0H81_12002 [Grifola frondosa]|uniref:Ribonuclease H1 N-terminal domain-containing protein n=1 Tax=Grifola frondosa TaxID=5627 RepID=A0A1C7LVY6_GRIFR|nr:hypothetical protein A0H81_12002 [Grifola frondosa]
MSVHKSEKVEAAEDAPVAAQVAATQVAAASSTASVENVGPSRCDNRDGDGVASDDSDEELYWRDDSFDNEALIQALDSAADITPADATPAAPVAAGPAPVAPAGPAAGALVVPGPTNIITATPTTSTLVGDTPPAYTAAAPPPACPPACPPAGPPTGPPAGPPAGPSTGLGTVNPNSRWYAVTRGTEVGVFQGWIQTSTYVTGVSGAIFTRHTSHAQAESAFQHALLLGIVQRVG